MSYIHFLEILHEDTDLNYWVFSHVQGAQSQPSAEDMTDQPEQQGTIQGSLTPMLGCS